MARLVISTVGTSVLTNQIYRDIDENGCYERLQQTANYTDNEIQHYPEIEEIISELKERAEKELYSDDTDKIRQASAELNGIYGLYNEQIEQGIPDMHLLVTTDTAQGQIAAEIVESFLKRKGLTNISTHAQRGLSTASSDIFVEGMAKLFPSMQETIKTWQKSKYTICFNLVGGFKPLQGYFNTIGMFYADEIIYVFEGSNQLIKIPKLPVKVDVSEIKPYEVQLAMMEVGAISTSWEEAKKVPQEWILVDGQEMTVSAWGQLLWEQCKKELLSKEKPLQFPKLEYHQSFLDDYEAKPAHEKIILQENLARAACLLKNHKDGISAMKQDGIFRLRRYVGKHKDIDHFDLPKDRRVSCIARERTLYLRHYGEHNYVNNNP
ncbi:MULTISPECIES: putative CRISPR-associated protein [unclassified Microcoleus]|uniref:putative CRISPR-associated protein n=1 Tax=unclassified Microcoleus TaxID=2642155 RepID=UPI002FD76B47